jgi:hypothetical protein
MTAPPDVIKKMVEHPLTDKGLDAFVKDAEDWDQEDRGSAPVTPAPILPKKSPQALESCIRLPKKRVVSMSSKPAMTEILRENDPRAA